MRVLVISPLPPQADGLGDYTARLIAGYRLAGHRVAAVPTSATTIPVESLGLLSLRPWRWLSLWSAMRRWNPDILHVQHTIATYGLRLPVVWGLTLTARLLGVHVVVTHHEVTRDIERLGCVGTGYYRLTSGLADRIHVHTAASAQALTRRVGVPAQRVIRQAHPICDLPPSSTSAAALRRRHLLSTRIILLSFGFIHVEKGLLETVHALRRLLADRPELRADLRLVVAGEVRPRPTGFRRFEKVDRRYLDEVRAAVAQDGLEDIVLFTGHVPPGEIRPWFTLADVVLLPYRATEQSGVAALAVAAGTPVLASRAGGLPEIFGTLPLLDSLEPEPFARSLAAAIDNLESLRHRTESQYARARSESSADQLVDAVTHGVPAKASS